MPRWPVGSSDARVRKRVSSGKLGFLCASAPSLSRHPMPFRITQESYRPRVSYRTMVGALPPALLASFRSRMASTTIRVMKPSECEQLGLTLRREKAIQTKWQSGEGAGCRRNSTVSGGGRRMSLDIPFYRTFPQPVFVRRSASTCDRCRAAIPILFKLHWTDVIQCRVQPCLVIPEQPVEDFILGLAKGFKVLPVQPLYLQRSEQRLAACVVPAVAFATHRGRNSARFEHAVELVTGVLAASVAVKNQRCLRSDLAV